jgi:hypothetical protein
MLRGLSGTMARRSVALAVQPKEMPVPWNPPSPQIVKTFPLLPNVR